MRIFGSPLLPVISFFLTGITANLFDGGQPLSHPYVVYRYPAAIVVIFLFFRFVAFTDKRRANQLDQVGLLMPLRDAAFLVCAHAHFLALGIKHGWISPDAGVEIGLFSWTFILIGHYAPKQPDGLPNQLLNRLPFIQPHQLPALCRGLTVSGGLGIIGTFTPNAPILWLLIPLAITIFRARKSNP